MPAALARLFNHPTLDWNLYSTLQQPLKDRKVCFLVDGSVCACCMHAWEGGASRGRLEGRWATHVGLPRHSLCNQ